MVVVGFRVVGFGVVGFGVVGFGVVGFGVVVFVVNNLASVVGGCVIGSAAGKYFGAGVDNTFGLA